MDDYVIEHLARATILNAYPLVQLAEPKMSVEAWKALARATIGRHASRGQGILVARRRSRQHISGMVCYHTERDFSVGRVLAANRLIAIDILDQRGIVLDLLRELRARARLLGCKTVRLMVEDRAWVAGVLPGAMLEADPASRVDHCMNVSFVS